MPRNVVTADPKQVAKLPSEIQDRLRRIVKPRLESNPQFGDRIRRRQWPKRFRDLPNLRRVAIGGKHRALYAVLTYPGRPREIRIVWLGDHASYDRLFGYGD